MKWPRSIAAVAAGYAVMTVILRLWGSIAAPGESVAWLAFSTIFSAAAGGFVTAWIAGNHEIPHAAGFGLLIVGVTLIAMHRNSISQPGWYEISVAGCGPVASMFGGSLRMLTKRKAHH